MSTPTHCKNWNHEELVNLDKGQEKNVLAHKLSHMGASHSGLYNIKLGKKPLAGHPCEAHHTRLTKRNIP